MAGRNQSNTWRFTLNNWTPEQYDIIKHWDVTRMAIGEETAPETGTKHLQGFVVFTRAMRFGAVTKMCPEAHWEPAYTKDWNYELKTDSEGWYIVDNRKQGKRTDLEETYTAMETGMTVAQYLDSRPNYQQIKVAETYRKYKPVKRPIAPIQVLWFWGGTGCGKSHAAFSDHPDAYIKDNSKWWDGYNNETTVIWDDFRPGVVEFAELLKLTDKYPGRLQVKGSSADMMWNTIIFTTPYSPEDTFRDLTPEHLGQLTRRITEVRHFPRRYVEGGSGSGREVGEVILTPLPPSEPGYWYDKSGGNPPVPRPSA